LLKKHYYNLLKCLPEDYIVSLNKLKHLVKLKEQDLHEIKSCASSEESNKKILDLLILPIQDKHLVKFFDVMEALATSHMKTLVQALRSGKIDLGLYFIYIWIPQTVFPIQC